MSPDEGDEVGADAGGFELGAESSGVEDGVGGHHGWEREWKGGSLLVRDC